MLQINASIAKHDNRIWCSYRTQHLYDYDSESFIEELDSEFETISSKRLVAENQNTAFEDVRLFSFGGKLLAFYTYFPFNMGEWTWIYGVGYGEVDLESGMIKNQVSLRDLSRRDNEKNWCPYNYKGELFMLTDFDPFLRVIKIDQIGQANSAKEFFKSAKNTEGWAYGELRGGTPLISKPGDKDSYFYGFAHSYRRGENGFERNYYYTAVKFNHVSQCFQYCPVPLPYDDKEVNEDYDLLWRYSNDKTLKVIFPIGIMHHNEGVAVSFGKDDVSSHIEYFSWEHIESMFN